MDDKESQVFSFPQINQQARLLERESLYRFSMVSVYKLKLMDLFTRAQSCLEIILSQKKQFLMYCTQKLLKLLAELADYKVQVLV